MSIEKIAKYWAFSSDFDENTNREIQELLQKKDKEQIEARFSGELEFGTGGLRGIIAAGSNRINLYTIRRTTQGFANYLLTHYPNPVVVIAYDNRHYSEQFARESACVLAASGIFSWVFPRLTPTPILSYAIRYLKASAGIMITASHNPPNYNGYKAFQSDGSQITSPKDIHITAEIAKISDYSKIQTGDWKTFLENKKIGFVSEAVLQSYYHLVEKNCFNKKEQNYDFGVIYTPLHGAGAIPVRELMKQRGFQNFRILAEQENPDPDFSTLKSPNPEDPSAMELAMKSAKKNEQLILATDPDADRLGVMVKDQGEWIFLDGNQIGVLLLYYKLISLKKAAILPKNGVFITTIVTSKLQKKIAQSFGVRVYESLTGFKNIAKIMEFIEKDPNQEFLFACEESNGYLATDQVRDKDGVLSTVLFAEMAAQQKEKGVMGLLAEIYKEYGEYYDSLVSFVLEGKDGKQKIQKIMLALRQNITSVFPQEKIIQVKDYQNAALIKKMKNENFVFSASNVFSCDLEGGSRITARPSGTEPKIKFYINLVGSKRSSLKQKAKNIQQAIEQFVKKL